MADLDVQVIAGLSASLGELAMRIGGVCDRLDRDAARGGHAKERASQAIRQVDFAGAVTLTSGAGTLQDFNRFGCPQGYIWSVRRLTAQGFTAGTVTAYKDSTSGEPVMPFAVAAVNLIAPGAILIHPMSQLVFGAAGITGTVTMWGSADQMESWLLPYYLTGTASEF